MVESATTTAVEDTMMNDMNAANAKVTTVACFTLIEGKRHVYPGWTHRQESTTEGATDLVSDTEYDVMRMAGAVPIEWVGTRCTGLLRQLVFGQNDGKTIVYERNSPVGAADYALLNEVEEALGEKVWDTLVEGGMIEYIPVPRRAKFDEQGQQVSGMAFVRSLNSDEAFESTAMFEANGIFDVDAEERFDAYDGLKDIKDAKISLTKAEANLVGLTWKKGGKFSLLDIIKSVSGRLNWHDVGTRRVRGKVVGIKGRLTRRVADS